MQWQYRTILFEYHKDGLLGDKYIDDEEVEQTLNEQGAEGWELVGVTPVQEGLLSFLKRPRDFSDVGGHVPPPVHTEKPAAAEPVHGGRKPAPVVDRPDASVRQPGSSPAQNRDKVDEIRIS